MTVTLNRAASRRSVRLHPLTLLGLVLALLWLGALLTGLDLAHLVPSGAAINAHGHTHLHAHGHPFIDNRMLLGIPNAMDVLTNLPFAIAGCWGLALLRRAPPSARRASVALFSWGLLLTAAGSAYYHWAPDAFGLMHDRLGMAVAFAGVLALAWEERTGALWSTVRGWLPWCLLAVAALSALLPYTHERLLPWVVLQFGGMLFVVIAALCRPASGALGVRLAAVAAIYAVAKALELGDEAVYHATDGIVSGHSAKHVVAALAAWPVLCALRTYSQP